MFRLLRRLLPCLVLLPLVLAAQSEEPIQLAEPQPSFSQEHYEAALKKFAAQDWDGAIVEATRHIELAELETKRTADLARAAQADAAQSTKVREYRVIEADNFSSALKGYFIRGQALGKRDKPGDAARLIADFSIILPEPEAPRSDAPQRSKSPALILPIDAIAECHVQRGYARYGLGDITGGLSDYVEARRLRPDDPYVLYWHAYGLANTGRITEAYADAVRAAELNPKDGQLSLLAAEVAWHTDHAPVALEMLDRILQASPDDSATRNQRAAVYQSLGRFTEAVADFDRVITQGNVETGPLTYAWVERHLVRSRLQLPSPGLPEFVATLPEGWSRTLGRFLTGALGEEELLAAANQGDPAVVAVQQCEALYHAGIWHLLHHEPAAARDLFIRCTAGRVAAYSEFSQLSRDEIRRLGAVP